MVNLIGVLVEIVVLAVSAKLYVSAFAIPAYYIYGYILCGFTNQIPKLRDCVNSPGLANKRTQLPVILRKLLVAGRRKLFNTVISCCNLKRFFLNDTCWFYLFGINNYLESEPI